MNYLPKLLLGISLVSFPTLTIVYGQQTSENSKRLKDGLSKYPEADTDKDGVLTMEEARAHLQERRKQGRGGRGQKSTIFKPSADELRTVVALGQSRGPHKFDEGNGLRIVMTGHSWVAPGRKTLEKVATGAGLDGHRQRAHISGGGTGAANAIWLKEFGRYDDKGPRVNLVPAIATGQWDVMTWGGYYEDKPVYFTQWMDLCLAHNSEMNFCLQDGWPRYHARYKGMVGKEVLQSMKSEYAEYRTRHKTVYDEMEKSYPGKFRIIPTGAAVVDLIGRHYEGKVPDFDCIDEKTNGGKKGVYRDGGTFTLSGTEWLVGYVYYGMLYRRSPQLIEDFKPDGVPVRLDATLREVAWKAVTSSPFSRITDKDGDGVAD